MAVRTFGGPEALEAVDLPIPEPGPGQVRVRVRAAGVQPFDTRVRAGWAPPSIRLVPPVVVGNEFAGVVDAHGPGASAFQPGAEVLGFTTLGCYAEYVVVPETQMVAKPPAMPWEVAGGFPANAQGAYQCLSGAGIHEGDTVFVNAAAGALGTFTVQLARAWGASTVIGSASPANQDHLRALGAVPVAYGPGMVDRVRAISDRVDAAVDLHGVDGLRAAVALVADRRRIRTMVDDDAATELGVPLVEPGRSAARLTELCALWEQGRIKVHIRHSYPLDRAADAHRGSETGHGRGKIVLTVD
ncbi:NADP-dependent oxidoreductase [Actinokineospora auranticolor]